MVTQMGYSDELGLVDYGSGQDEPFVGMSMGKQNATSRRDCAQDRCGGSPPRRSGISGCQEDPLPSIMTNSLRSPKRCSSSRTLSGEELIGLREGKRPRARRARDTAPARGFIVPTAGGKKKSPPTRGEPDPGGPGIEPQPT